MRGRRSCRGVVSIRSSTMHDQPPHGAQQLSVGIDDEQRRAGRVAGGDRLVEPVDEALARAAGARAAPRSATSLRTARRPALGPARRSLPCDEVNFVRPPLELDPAAAVGNEPRRGVEAPRALVRLEDPERHGRVPRRLERRRRRARAAAARCPGRRRRGGRRASGRSRAPIPPGPRRSGSNPTIEPSGASATTVVRGDATSAPSQPATRLVVERLEDLGRRRRPDRRPARRRRRRPPGRRRRRGSPPAAAARRLGRLPLEVLAEAEAVAAVERLHVLDRPAARCRS